MLNRFEQHKYLTEKDAEMDLEKKEEVRRRENRDHGNLNLFNGDDFGGNDAYDSAR